VIFSAHLAVFLVKNVDIFAIFSSKLKYYYNRNLSHWFSRSFAGISLQKNRQRRQPNNPAREYTNSLTIVNHEANFLS
jgi:hypothetical protein